MHFDGVDIIRRGKSRRRLHRDRRKTRYYLGAPETGKKLYDRESECQRSDAIAYVDTNHEATVLA